MRAIILLVSLLIYTGTVAGEAYLLIDAISLPESSKQPTWLGVRKGSRMHHFPTRQSIIHVAPGRYRLHHIDFDRSKRIGSDTIFTSDPEEFVFKALQDSIIYVGLVQVEQDRLKSRKNKVKIETTKLLFEWACDKNPKVFKRLPVKFLGDENAGKEIRINCET